MENQRGLQPLSHACPGCDDYDQKLCQLMKFVREEFLSE